MLSIVRKSVKGAQRNGLWARQNRSMSGGHGGPPPTGFEAKVRAYLPEDHQVYSRLHSIYFLGVGSIMLLVCC